MIKETTMPDQNEQSTPKRQNNEQQRGRQAWINIQAIKDRDKSSEKKLEKEYRSLARGLNAMIQINGLGQTLGFLQAKAKAREKVDEKKPHYQLLLHLTNWMQEQEHFKAKNSQIMKSGYNGLLLWIIDPDTSSDDYRRATTECLAFGVWLRRFAEGELKEPEAGDNIE
jgi:CRISPR-associated protein Cmr5